LHADYARALTERPELAGTSPTVLAGELAIHWDAAGELTRALPARIQAGLAAERAHAFAEAASHYGRALELWDQMPNHGRPAGLDRVDLLAYTADAVAFTGAVKHAVTESLCTSRPAQRSTSVSTCCLLHLGERIVAIPEEPLRGESESRAGGNSAGCPRLPRQRHQRARGTKKAATSAGRPAHFHPSRVAGHGHGRLISKRQGTAVQPCVFARGARP
jgi:hypothetical protein